MLILGFFCASPPPTEYSSEKHLNSFTNRYGLSGKLPPAGQPVEYANIDTKEKTVQDPVLGTKFSLESGKQVGPWCPSGPGIIVGKLFPSSDISSIPVRISGSNVEVKVNVNAKAQFESGYWKGILDAQGKADGGYY